MASAPKDTKGVVSDSKNGSDPTAQEKKPATQLEEDDEFEDFPVEGSSYSYYSKEMGRRG